MRVVSFGLLVGFSMFIVWVVFLANTGGQSIWFQWVAQLPYGDKIGHAGLFGLLALLLNWVLRFARFSIKGVNFYFASVLVLSVVSLEELSQLFIASRTFDVGDLAADVVGVVIASVVARVCCLSRWAWLVTPRPAR